MRYAALLLGALALLVSCVSTAEVESMSEVGPGEVVVVGRIVLDPPLQEHEQNLPWTVEGYRNQVVFLVDGRLHSPEQFWLSDLSRAQRADLGSLFTARVPREQVLYYSAPRILLDQANYMLLPGGLEIHVPPEARLVYFGTLVYSRDVYSAITGVKLRDELEQAREEIAERFGPGLELVPAVVQPAK